MRLPSFLVSAESRIFRALSGGTNGTNSRVQFGSAAVPREEERSLYQAIERAVPNWREINRDPRWLRWLAGYHDLSGCVRQQLLDDAAARGDAHRVISFFRGFLREEATAGRQRQATAGSAGKPIYTRAQIAHLGHLRRKGAYSDAEWARWEEEIIAAGREGRIAGALDIHGR